MLIRDRGDIASISFEEETLKDIGKIATNFNYIQTLLQEFMTIFKYIYF